MCGRVCRDSYGYAQPCPPEQLFMFVGHLAAGLVLKARVPKAPLSWLLFATIAPDLLCGALLLAGVEHAHFEGSMTFAHLRGDAGYSHSLLASVVYSVLAGWFGSRHWHSTRVGVALALAVFSHFVLDALSHHPDMPLLGFDTVNDIHTGTGLASQPAAFYLVELAWCALACVLFDRSNTRLLGTFAMLMALYTNLVFGFVQLPPLAGREFGAVMLVIFSLAALVVGWAASSRTAS
ncbi:MAG: hypothetical protein RL701_1445 [Pseudomonadota bacterium]